jgi:hypothetical protein
MKPIKNGENMKKRNKKAAGGVKAEKKAGAERAKALAVNTVSGGTEKLKSKSLVIIIIAALLVFTVVELTFITKQSLKMEKKPEFVAMWDHHPYTGISFFNEIGDSLYGVDDVRGQVIRFNKVTGQLIHIYNIDTGVYNCVEDSDKNLNILDRQGNIYRFEPDFKLKDKFKVPEVASPSWITVDSKGNMFIADNQSMKIYKFDSSFKLLKEFGKRGSGKGEFEALIKLFPGPKDDIYCLTGLTSSGKKGVSIFTNDGGFKKSWPLKNIKAWSNLDHLAITPKGDVYMNCSSDNNIYVFNNDGQPIGKFDSCKNNACVITYPGSISGGMSGILYVYTHQILSMKNIDY